METVEEWEERLLDASMFEMAEQHSSAEGKYDARMRRHYGRSAPVLKPGQVWVERGQQLAHASLFTVFKVERVSGFGWNQSAYRTTPSGLTDPITVELLDQRFRLK